MAKRVVVLTYPGSDVSRTSEHLRRGGWVVIGVSTPRSVLNMVRRYPPDLILLEDPRSTGALSIRFAAEELGIPAMSAAAQIYGDVAR